jgi:drug/metabolite transporter (DMT)-like permease
VNAPGARRVGAGPVFALLSALTFATSGTFASSLLAIGWTPGAAVLFRIGTSAVVLLVPGILSLRGRWYLLRDNGRAVLLFGTFAVALAQLSYFTAVQYLSVGVALLIEYLSPVLVVLWLWARHGHAPRRLTIGGVAVAMAGLLLVLDLTGAVVHPVGVLWSLTAAVGAAVYFVIAGSIPDDLPTIALTSAAMVVATALFAVAAGLGVMPLAAPAGEVALGGREFPWWVAALGVALISSVAAYLTGAAGARILGSKVASVFGLLEVLAAVGYAWLLLGQAMRPIQLMGGAAILGGLTLVHLDERDRTPALVELPAPNEVHL